MFNFVKRADKLIISLLFVFLQMVPLISQMLVPPIASAATQCTVDAQGANDQPGQKDLTQYCISDPGATTQQVGWQWDETSWSGNNTGDACALYDTDNDGKVNRAVCVTISGVSTLSATRVYSCNDTKTDRCAASNSLLANTTTSCTVSSQPTQPFAAGSDSPNDATTDCNIVLSEVQNGNLVDVCSYPSSNPNSDPSDCIELATSNPKGKLEIKKILSPSNDSGLFNLQLNGNTVISNISNNGTTGVLGVDAGTYTVGESAGSNSNLGNYSASIVCRDRRGNVLSSGSGYSLDVTVSDSGNGSEVTCTITNTRLEGSLKVIKNVVNNDGGSLTYEDFTYQVNGGSAGSFNNSGNDEDGVVVLSYPAGSGTYSVTEPEANSNGYATSYNNCSDISIVANETVTCTITNDDVAPKLTVTKVVNNYNGGTLGVQDFTLYVGATVVTSGEQNNFSAGSVTVTEADPSAQGYEGAVSGDCASDGTIILQLGGVYNCTITNTDLPATLTIHKNIKNDNGGKKSYSDFSYDVNDGDYSGSFDEDGIVELTVPAGIYNVTEPEANSAGYTTEYDGCDNIILTNGGSADCYITNNDQPATLKVVKDLVNDNGGNKKVTDFGFTIDNQHFNFD